MAHLAQLTLFILIAGWIRSVDHTTGGPAIGLLALGAVYLIMRLYYFLTDILRRVW